MLSLSRRLATIIGGLTALATLGGFVLGLSVWDGHFIALACMLAGVTLTCYLWWSNTEQPALTTQRLLLVVSFVLIAGLALYANLAWALWALGVPVEIGTVKDGRMTEHYWLGPATLFYAVLCYMTLNWKRAQE